MRKPTPIIVALLGLAGAAPAQFHFGFSNHHFRVDAFLGACAPRYAPVRHAPVRYGEWRTVCERVWVPACYREECVPARYGWVRDRCGRLVWGVVEPACTRQVLVPGHFETRERRVWVSL